MRLREVKKKIVQGPATKRQENSGLGILDPKPFLNRHCYNKEHSLITSINLLNTYSGPGTLIAKEY